MTCIIKVAFPCPCPCPLIEFKALYVYDLYHYIFLPLPLPLTLPFALIQGYIYVPLHFPVPAPAPALAPSPTLCSLPSLLLPLHYGVIWCPRDWVFFAIKIGKIWVKLIPFRVLSGSKCHLVGLNYFDYIQLSLSYLANYWDKLTSQGIRNCKISFKLTKAAFQRPPWWQDPPLHLLKPSDFTHIYSHQPK